MKLGCEASVISSADNGIFDVIRSPKDRAVAVMIFALLGTLGPKSRRRSP